MVNLFLAGICWSGPGQDGRCTKLLQRNVTADQCCNGVDSSNYGITSIAFSEDIKDGELFYYRVLRGGVPCKACKGKPSIV